MKSNPHFKKNGLAKQATLGSLQLLVAAELLTVVYLNLLILMQTLYIKLLVLSAQTKRVILAVRSSLAETEWVAQQSLLLQVQIMASEPQLRWKSETFSQRGGNEIPKLKYQSSIFLFKNRLSVRAQTSLKFTSFESCLGIPKLDVKTSEPKT